MLEVHVEDVEDSVLAEVEVGDAAEAVILK